MRKMRSMALLRGELGFLPAVAIFRLLGERAFTGALEVRKGAAEKRLWIREGAVVQATSTDPREFIGQILIYGGHLSEEAFEAAFQAQAAKPVPLGELLIQLESVPEAAVRDALNFKNRETGIELCAWREGEFQALNTPLPLGSQRVEAAPIPLLELAEAARERASAWARIRKLLPSGATRLAFRAGRRAPAAASGSVEDRIFSLLTEPRSIDELQLFLHATRFHLYAKLHSLVGDGVIQIEPTPQALRADGGSLAAAGALLTAKEPAAAAKPAPKAKVLPKEEESPLTPPPLPLRSVRERPAPPPPSLGAAELVERSRAALAKDAPELAVELARKALQVEASNEVVEALREAEAQLLLRLRAELVGKDLRPEAIVDRERLRDLPLTPPARYLLTRMNGSREIGAIVRIAPMRELDALEVIKRLLRDGLIRASGGAAPAGKQPPKG